MTTAQIFPSDVQLNTSLKLLLQQLHAAYRNGYRPDPSLLTLLWMAYEPHSKDGVAARLACYGIPAATVDYCVRKLREEAKIHSIPAPFGRKLCWTPTEDGQRIVDQILKP